MTYTVKIINLETDEVEDTFPTGSKRAAERLERGININLDHGRYYTSISKEEGEE